jgi:hypothetical protein
MVALDKYVEHFSTCTTVVHKGTSNLAKSACQEVARLVTYAHTSDNQICRQLKPCPLIIFIKQKKYSRIFWLHEYIVN